MALVEPLFMNRSDGRGQTNSDHNDPNAKYTDYMSLWVKGPTAVTRLVLAYVTGWAQPKIAMRSQLISHEQDDEWG